MERMTIGSFQRTRISMEIFSEVVAGLSKIATGSTQLSVSDEKWESIVTRRASL